MNYILKLVLLITSTLSTTASAGNVQSLRTDADGNIVASVRGEESAKVPQMWKQYTDSNTSKGVVDVTLTGATLLSIARGVFIPYQTADGAWRLKFNIAGTLTADSSFDLVFAGVVYKNTPGNWQAVTVHTGSSAITGGIGYCTINTDKIRLDYSVAASQLRVSGDVELDSKPTWAE